MIEGQSIQLGDGVSLEYGDGRYEPRVAEGPDREDAFRRFLQTSWLVTGAAATVVVGGAGEGTANSDQPYLPDGRHLHLMGPTFRRIARALERDLEEEDWETAIHLRLALSYIDRMRDESDPIVASLLAYQAASALLLRDDSEIPHLADRAAFLAGIAKSDRASILNFAAALIRFVDAIQRGRLPDLSTRSRLLGRKVSRDHIDLVSSWTGEAARKVIQLRASEMFRRMLLAFITLSLSAEEGRPVVLVATRRKIIESLEKAKKGDAEAKSGLEANAVALFGE